MFPTIDHRGGGRRRVLLLSDTAKLKGANEVEVMETSVSQVNTRSKVKVWGHILTMRHGCETAAESQATALNT